ncbi:MAG: SIMPL domain-containing protein [Muriicola sp.]|nr:SIMPL domain-containing protein [Muriicola sp.]NNK10086.1 SIMPL domain-containing protein [Flavobacteriaceae bacterium]
MKNILPFFLFFLTVLAVAQSPIPQLEVTGSAQLAIAPDTGVLNMSLSQIEMQFGDAINGLNRKTEDIKAQIRKMGFSEEVILTDNFQVRKNIKYRNSRQIDSGYVATQQIHFDFENTVGNIRKILSQFSSGATEFDLHFSFKLSDPLKDKVQERLIQLATEDAFQKARVIANASGTELQKVLRIQYGNSYNAPVRTERAVMSFEADALKVDGFTPTDLTYNATILVVWAIE